MLNEAGTYNQSLNIDHTRFFTTIKPYSYQNFTTNIKASGHSYID